MQSAPTVPNMSAFPVLLITVATLLLPHLNAIDVAESNTGAVLAFESVIDGPLFDKSYEVAPAQFGYQRYGGSMSGVLILPKNTTFHKECPAAREPLDINPYIHYIRDWFVSAEDITDYILVIDRLDCYFVDKIEWAQKMGASGVIMCDWKYEKLFTMWMPQDWNDDIHIPSILLQRKNCETLMAHLGVIDWDPQDITNTQYPSPETINWTIATIEWGLPHDDDRVEWELWTSSNDYLGSEFKHNFNTTAIMLDKANDTIFTPHMYILNGSHWGCDELVIINSTNTTNSSVYLPCSNQCTNSGRYCAVDPEYDLSLGLDGMDVIQENLRSLCVWKYDKSQLGIMDDIMWWDYAVLWDENCGVYSNSSLNFHVNCSFAQMDKLDSSGGLSTFVQNCILQSGGYDYIGPENSILRTETKLKYNSSIYALPMIRVNEFLIHGNIDCPPPVTQHTCEVLAAICAGFLSGTQPDVCFLTPAPTIPHCNETEKDCSGACHGTHEIDACSRCLLVSDPLWNECIGCNGQINATYDCGGTCGGHYAVNYCGYCKDTRLPGFATFGVDCLGGCDANLKTDECGQCLTESDLTWNACVGCDNVPFSGFAFNSCGRCLDSSTPDFADFGKDCAAVCDGDAEVDECGLCLSTSSTQWNSCVGCDNVPHSNKQFNECGRCVDADDADFTEYGRDCSGQCDGAHEMDDCAQCLLPTNPEFGACCEGDINKKNNECGLCLFKNVTDFHERGRDCQGACDGAYVMDACGACLLPTDPAFDSCIACAHLNLTFDCADVCGGNHAVNPCGICMLSGSEDFEENGRDCQGSCNGRADVDQCGNCLLTTDSDWNSCVGCDGVAGSDMEINPCGMCILSTRSDFAAYGRDCSDECGGGHEMDQCGACLLQSDNENWNSCVGCDGAVNSEYVENDCGICALPTDDEFDDYGRDCSGECSLIAANTHYIDECGQCLLPRDESWNDCVDNKVNNTVNTGGNADGMGVNGNDSSLMWIIVIAAAAVGLVCCALVVIVYLCQKHREMKRQFDEIQQTYRPMDEMARSSNKTTKRGMTTVPNEESD